MSKEMKEVVTQDIQSAAAEAFNSDNDPETTVISEETLLPALQQFSGVTKIGTKAANSHIETLMKMGEFIGVESEKLDSYINKKITVVGAVMHEASVRVSDKESPDFGKLAPVDRIAILLEDGTVVGAVSVAVTSFFTNLIFPAFGMGRWLDANGNPIKVIMEVSPTPTRSGGRSYNLRVIGKA